VTPIKTGNYEDLIFTTFFKDFTGKKSSISNAISSAQQASGRLDFFSSESTWPGLSEMIRHIGLPGPCRPLRAFLKHPNIQLKNCKVALILPYHHFSPLGKIFHFMRIFF
jgi:hypothetical protein